MVPSIVLLALPLLSSHFLQVLRITNTRKSCPVQQAASTQMASTSRLHLGRYTGVRLPSYADRIPSDFMRYLCRLPVVSSVSRRPLSQREKLICRGNSLTGINVLQAFVYFPSRDKASVQLVVRTTSIRT